MSNNDFYGDDASIGGSSRPSHPGGQGSRRQQDKLILGSFQDEQPPNRTRKPYQNPMQSTQPPRQQPQWQRQQQMQQQERPSQQPQQAYPVYPQQAAQTSRPPQSPARGYPYTPVGGASAQRNPRPQKRPRRRTGCLIGCLSVLVLLCVLGAFFVSVSQKVLAFGSAISTQPPLTSQTDYMTTPDRVNLLVMGYGGGDHPGANLTDSMMVMSVLGANDHTTLISVPRDLWVQIPEGSGNYGKINAVYEYASNNGQNPVAGGNAAAAKVSLVTGLDVRYWLTINFTGFKEFIDSIGGIDVYVPDSFNACYPANDDPTVNASWIKVQFNKGEQHMNGATAIEYARAREPLSVCGMGNSENLAELTDFARSARQQIIIKAAMSKLRQVSTWPKLYDALNALQKTVYTNMSLADLARFALSMNLNTAHRIGLSNQNVLVDSTSSDGQYILLPENNNWQAIVAYVKQNLYN
ncbi:MAG TPA: LCP family protein [Ktedonobacteraceae bacterium]|nr:LCP family protein [Ktedonobacteraceae bacterium]